MVMFWGGGIVVATLVFLSERSFYERLHDKQKMYMHCLIADMNICNHKIHATFLPLVQYRTVEINEIHCACAEASQSADDHLLERQALRVAK
jgi:hypothetical protein